MFALTYSFLPFSLFFFKITAPLFGQRVKNFATRCPGEEVTFDFNASIWRNNILLSGLL